MNKYQRSTAMLAAILAVTATAQSASATERTTTAFNAFKVRNTYGANFDPYTCLSESYGAVVNNCPGIVDLTFDMPIDKPGSHRIVAQGYWSGPAGFSCVPYSYQGEGPTGQQGSYINFVNPGEEHVTSVSVNAGGSITLICEAVPVGGGVANIGWSP